jgi:hypothetical protein
MERVVSRHDLDTLTTNEPHLLMQWIERHLQIPRAVTGV